MLPDYLRAQALRVALRQYPDAWRRMMPTRLGNVLRRYEDKAGQQYGLDIIYIAPHLNLVALPEHREYVDDCRKGLDLACDFAFFSLSRQRCPSYCWFATAAGCSLRLFRTVSVT